MNLAENNSLPVGRSMSNRAARFNMQLFSPPVERGSKSAVFTFAGWIIVSQKMKISQGDDQNSVEQEETTAFAWKQCSGASPRQEDGVLRRLYSY